MTGAEWEAQIARENHELHDAGRAAVFRVPTHMFGGHPWGGPKVDFVGCLEGGQHVALEAKAEGGKLSRGQRLLLAHTSRLGGVALVYRSVGGERHLCPVSAAGVMTRKSDATRVLSGETWLCAWIRRCSHTETECF